MLKKFKIDPIGGLKPDERDVVYGLGMVKAPSGCGPKAWATKTTPAPIVPAEPPSRTEALGFAWPPAKVHPAAGGG